MPDEGKYSYNEAGRRIKAALISYIAGYAGIGSTLKKVPAIVEERWAELAKHLVVEMINAKPASTNEASENVQ